MSSSALEELLGTAPPREEGCRRCAQNAEQRKRDHKTTHAPDCPNRGRGGRKLGEATTALVAASGALPATLETGRESAKRITQQVRSGLMATFEAMGGEAALLEWARANPTRFFDMWARAVPRESESANKGAGVTVVVGTVDSIRARRDAPQVIDVTPERVA